ncbi:MAG TPA: carboxypeptidase-like regulatory domain-containing protein [Longimicrobium sp.]
MSRAALLLSTLIATAPALPAAAQEGPVLRGRVVTADGAPAAGMRVHAGWQGSLDAQPRWDSATVDSAGRFRLPLPDSLPDSLTVVVDAADAALRAHHPAVARVPRAQVRDREHGFVLAPREWAIPAGFYAGRRVPISPDLARQPTCAGCSGFWIRMGGPRAGTGFQGWISSRFPLRVAFERGGSVPVGAAPDSAAFWRAAAGVEEALGQDLFRPVPFAATLPRDVEDDPDDVVLVRIDRTLSTGGLTTMVGSRGNVEYAGLALQRASAVLEQWGLELVQHELMHVLGLGHTCAWRSVLADVTRCPRMRAPSPTPQDVAYTQLLYRVRELQRGGTLRWGLDAATDAERLPSRGAVPGRDAGSRR